MQIPELRGAFIGLNLTTSQENLFYAVIEGLCFGFRELAEKMCLPLEKYGTVKVVGGGSQKSSMASDYGKCIEYCG